MSESSEIKNKGEPEKSSGSGKCLQINKATLPLKIILFLFSGAMAAILPYLTLHMQEIGITIQETAIIYAVLPFTTFMGPPLMGFLADKFGQYKPVLILATIGSGAFHTSLLAVPTFKDTSINAAVMFSYSISSNEALIFPSSPKTCEAFITVFSESTTLNAQISSCKVSLPEFNAEHEVDNSCQIYSLPNELSRINCTPVGTERIFLRRSVESADLKIEKISKGDCSISVEIPRGTDFIGEREIMCETNLVFPSGERLFQGSNAVTFWVYFLLRILATMFMSSCFSLLDATTLAIINKTGNAEYGKERIWSVVGFGTISPIAGLLVDQVSQSKGYTDYSAAFYVSDVLLCLTIGVFFIMDLEVEKPEKGMMKNVQKLFKYPEVMVFLIMIFLLGTLWGFVESYLFIFLKELDAPNYLLGLTLSVGAIAGIPFSYGSERIFNRFGRVNIIILAFLTYFVRFFGYSYITSPFWCFPFEAMEAFTYHTMWIAAATYCSELAPKGMLATLMGVMGSLHYGLGKGNGAFIGGYMIGEIQTRLSFRYLGIAAGVFGVFFYLLHFFWLDTIIHNRIDKTKGSVSSSKEEEEELKPIDSPTTEAKKISTNGFLKTDDSVKIVLP